MTRHGGRNAFNKMLYAFRAMVKGKRNAQATVVFSILRIRNERCCLVACRLPAGNINFPSNFMMCDHVCVRLSYSPFPCISLRLSHFRSLRAFTTFISVEICIFIIYLYMLFQSMPEPFVFIQLAVTIKY